MNIPVIAFCNTDSALHHIDVAIPCNNKGAHAVGLMWWLLAREVLRMRGSISRQLPWEVMPDLYFYRDPEEVRMTMFLNNINSWCYLKASHYLKSPMHCLKVLFLWKGANFTIQIKKKRDRTFKAWKFVDS